MIDDNLTWDALKEGCIVAIDKPLTWTSFDVIRKIQFTTRVIKLGHAGTLDPLATGLLLICTGKCTKLISSLQDMPKEYTGTIKLGATTPSFDKETEEDNQFDISGITKSMIVDAAQKFSGDILQIPPMYSSIKVEGERSYDLARNGEGKELMPRPVHVYAVNIANIMLPEISFKIRVSKGFYVRSFARDLGVTLGAGAYLSSLRRTAIGDYKVDNAWKIDEFITHIQKLIPSKKRVKVPVNDPAKSGPITTPTKSADKP